MFPPHPVPPDPSQYKKVPRASSTGPTRALLLMSRVWSDFQFATVWRTPYPVPLMSLPPSIRLRSSGSQEDVDWRCTDGLAELLLSLSSSQAAGKELGGKFARRIEIVSATECGKL